MNSNMSIQRHEVRPIASAPFCSFCGKTCDGKTKCSGCSVTSYCSEQHQTAHQPIHVSACEDVRLATREFESQKDEHTSPLLHILSARTLSRPARSSNLFTLLLMPDFMNVIVALGRIAPPTYAAVERQLEHATYIPEGDHCRVLSMHALVPALTLRLRQDHKCLEHLMRFPPTGSWTVVVRNLQVTGMLARIFHDRGIGRLLNMPNSLMD